MNDWWPEAWNRLGWVLVHFLWQGAVIGALARFTARLMRNSTAQTRYLVLCAALAACGLAPIVTWLVLAPGSATPHVLAPMQSPSSATFHAALPPTGPQLIPLLAADTTASPAQTHLAQILETSLLYLVLAWSLGVLILSLRLILGWLELRRIRANGRPVASEMWRHRLTSLCAQIGITRAIRFIESAQVDVPAVFGWLKPVLIVPAAFFATLPPDQIEAILAHELAHIRRHDYIINLLQLVIETLLFYHPAVWWISRAVRNERENCCDDLAVQIIGDRLAYASALAALEESRTLSLNLALAATGGTLLDRVRRLLSPREVRTSRQAWFAPLALALILATIIGAGVYAYAEEAQAESDDPFGKADFSPGSLDDNSRIEYAFRNAVIQDKVGLAEAFLRHGFKMAPADIKSGIGDILSDAAWFTRDPKMVRMLIAHGAKPAGDAHNWRATVNMALKLGNKEIVDMLIAAGATFDPVTYAAALGPLDQLKKLDAQKPFDAKQIAGALDYAAGAGQPDTFDWLWAKAQTSDDAANAKKLSGFYSHAAQDGHMPFLLHLEQTGFKPADGGQDALLSALSRNQVAVASYLFEKGVPFKEDPKYFRSMLGEAAGEGHLQICELLLDHGADINAKDSEGMTPLCWGAYSGHDDVCTLLVQRGADLTIPDKYGRTAVWYAAGSTHCSGALELMLKKGVQINWTDSNGWSLLTYAMNFMPAQMGVQGFPGNVLTPADQRAYDAREERTIDLLISAGLDPSGKAGTDSPLKIVLQANHYPAARALLRHHPDINLKDAQGNPAITYLFNYCHSAFPLDLLETMLQMGADPNASYPSPGVTPPINYTVFQTALGSFRYPSRNQLDDQRAAIQLMIKHGARFPGVTNPNDGALLIAAANGDQQGMKDALARGASPDAKDSAGYSAMALSMTLHYFDNALWLLQQGADPKKIQTGVGSDLLVAAVDANRLDLVNTLLSKGVTSTGLESAIRNGNKAMFDTLIKAGANPKEASIFTCIQYGQPEMARVLLDGGVDPQPPPFAENRANVYWAVSYNQPEILKMLLDHGADPTMIDAYGETPLSVAQQFHKEMIPVIEDALSRRHQTAIAGAIPPGMEKVAQMAADDFKQGRLDQAAAGYDQMTKAQPDSLFAWSNLGVVRFQQRRNADARDAFEHATHLKPDDAFAAAQLGITYYQLEAYDKAVPALKTAIQLDPNDANTHYFLSLAYRALKQPQAADTEQQKAQALQSQPAPPPKT